MSTHEVWHRNIETHGILAPALEEFATPRTPPKPQAKDRSLLPRWIQRWAREADPVEDMHPRWRLMAGETRITYLCGCWVAWQGACEFRPTAKQAHDPWTFASTNLGPWLGEYSCSRKHGGNGLTLRAGSRS